MADTVTYDYSQGDISAVSGAAGVKITRLVRVVDVPTLITAASASLTSATTLTAAESITVFTLPVGFLVMGTVVYVHTVGTGTIDIGIPADETALDAAVDISAVGWANTETDAQGIASGGYLITATTSDADNIIVQFNSTGSTGRFVIAVWGIDFSDLIQLGAQTT